MHNLNPATDAHMPSHKHCFHCKDIAPVVQISGRWVASTVCESCSAELERRTLRLTDHDVDKLRNPDGKFDNCMACGIHLPPDDNDDVLCLPCFTAAYNE